MSRLWHHTDGGGKWKTVQYSRRPETAISLRDIFLLTLSSGNKKDLFHWKELELLFWLLDLTNYPFIHLFIYELFVSFFFTLPPFLSKDFPMEKAVKKSAPAPAGTDERACGAGRRLVPGRVCKVVELRSRRLSWREWGYLGTPLHHWWPAHLPTFSPSSAVTCPASDIRHSGAGCASAKKIWVATLWMLTILTNNGYFNELTNWLFVNHIVFIFKKKESIKTWKMGKVQWAMIPHFWTMLGHLGACGGLILLKLLLMQKTAKAFQG